MTRENLDAYVTDFDHNRINLRGYHLDDFFAYSNSKIVERIVDVRGEEKIIRTVVLTYDDESKTIDSLQRLVNHGIPFCDDLKSTAYQKARSLLQTGILKGEVLSC